MQSISIKLDIQCEICENYEYLQHDSGYYVCCICGTMSGVRHGIYLDYEEKNVGKYKIKRKGVEEEDNEDAADYQNYDTTMNTVVNTCANSEFGDSISTMKSRNKNEKQSKKSLNEILSDHQSIFIKLFKSIFSIQVQKSLKILSKKISDVHNHNQFDFSKLFEIFLEKSKSIWREFILLEYKNQIEKKPTFKQSSTKIRSRRNTDDNPNERKQSFNFKNKKNSIKDELKTRKIKQNNIVTIDDYQYNKLKSKDKLKKFIEEYDQVVSSLKMEESLLASEGIELNGNISFKNLLKIASILKIPVQDNSTFEQVIHQIFIHRNLNLLSLYKEATFDESKSNLNSDNFLTLIYSIFNTNGNYKGNNFILNQELIFPVLLYRDISEIFKNFSLNNLFNNELKFLKYLNRERLLKLLDSFNKKNPNFRVEKLFVHICEDILHLPNFFSNFCIKIYSQSEKQIERIKNQIYNLENISLGVIVYVLKLFYGLNDLPYLLTISKNKEKFFFDEKILKENFVEIKNSTELFESIAVKDHLFQTFYQLPSLIQIVDTLKHLIRHDEASHNLWEQKDLKKQLSNEYKENFVNYNLNYFSNVENNFTINHINSLEKQINKLKLDKTVKSEGQKNNPIKFNFSKKFLSKRKTLSQSEKELRKFLIEEIEFYNLLVKKKKIQNCEVPLPCDTYLRYNKKAMKFDGITPPLSELVIMYYFSKYFKVEYKVLKKCCKIIEGAIENQFK